MLGQNNRTTYFYFVLFHIFYLINQINGNNEVLSDQNESDGQISSSESIPTQETNDSDKGSNDMVLIGKAVLVLAALKLTFVIFLYFIWKKIKSIIMPRRNVDISEGPTLKSSSVWDWLEPDNESSDSPELINNENLRYKGVLYVRVADEESSIEDQDLPQTQV